MSNQYAAAAAQVLDSATAAGAEYADAQFWTIRSQSMYVRNGVVRRVSDRSSIGYAVMSSAIIACYTLSDGMGVRRAGSAVGYTLWLFFLNAWGFFALAWWRRRGRFIDGLRQRWRASLSGGALSIGAYGIALWAMTVASIPAVAALRETSVIFAALLGTWILKEHMGRVRLVGAALVALGAIAVRLA